MTIGGAREVPGIVALVERDYVSYPAAFVPIHTQVQVLHHSLRSIPCHPSTASHLPSGWGEVDLLRCRHTELPRMGHHREASGSLASSNSTLEAIYQTWDLLRMANPFPGSTLGTQRIVLLVCVRRSRHPCVGPTSHSLTIPSLKLPFSQNSTRQ